MKINLNNYNEYQSDDDCSCNCCECSSSSDENIPISFKHNCFSINDNHPSVNLLRESNIENIPMEIKHLSSIEDYEINFEHIYKIIDQSYTNIPILYNSIKQTKLDTDFILSVNNYLDRLKSNIYKDLIRRETLLRNGKTHTKNIISLIRCICKISYNQSIEISDDFNTIKRTILYIMTAIDYIIQINFPQKKPLFNYILNEFISMWLHENFRIIQEDFSIIENIGIKKNFFLLCICLFQKLESICAINWERLQMIQNYRLTHFNQLMKIKSIQLEINKDFILLFGKLLNSTMKKSDIPITLLYSNRTDNELININQIDYICKKSIAKIFYQQSDNSTNNLNIDDQKLISSTSSELINVDLNSKDNPISLLHQSSPSDIIEEQQHQPLSIEITSKKNTSSFVHTDHSSSSSHSIPSISNEPPINLCVESFSNLSTPIISIKSDPLNNDNSSLTNHTPLIFISSKKPFEDNHLLSSSSQILTNKSLITDSKTLLHTEINTLINFLTDLAYSSLSSNQQEKQTLSLSEQLESCLKQNNINPNLIIKKIHHIQPESSLNVNDPLFLATFTHVLRKELEDAQILRQIDLGQLNEDSQNIGYLSFETKNILKLPQINTSIKNNIDQNRIFIEVTHDPSRCTPSSLHYQRFNYNNPPKSMNPTSLSSNKFNNQHSPLSETNQLNQQWYWKRSNEYSSSKDCIITPNSLFCSGKTFDKNTYSITIEHNEQFQ